MDLSEVNLREKDFHNKLISQGNNRSENKYYKALNNLYVDFFKYLEMNIKNKNILDYGCGIGGYTVKVLDFAPLKITGIDISEEAIKIAKKRNIQNNKVEFRVENCENTKLNSNQFDFVYGAGILHHLNLERSIQEINRILKANGKLIFIEPMGTNPIINFYRKLTPKSRSEDEHPFKFKDIKYLKGVFKNVEVSYYGFFTLLFLPFYSKPKDSRLFDLLSKIDKYIFKIPIFKFLAWSAIIKAEKN